MRLTRWCLAVAFIASSTAHASLDGAGSIIYIPVVANTASYSSEVTVRNPWDFALPIAVFYTGATATTYPGLHACTALNVPAYGSVQFSPGSQCSLPTGGQFGLLTLEEQAPTASPFQAYSRTQTPGGNGFSVPAFPAGAIEAPYWGHFALGLKRQAAPPVYQTNCFVASTDDATPYQIQLLDASGNPLGNPISGSLSPYQMVRYLDIFTAAGLPAGDYSNVTAEFTAGASPTAALLSFCTVQESTYFGADFRIAQPVQTMDGTRQRWESVSTPHSYVPDAFTMTRYDLGVRHPDFVRCYLTSATGALQLRVISPDGTLIEGGTGFIDTGKFYTGSRALYNGFSNLWHVDVASLSTYLGPFPVYFSFECDAGNGMSINTIPLELPRAF